LRGKFEIDCEDVAMETLTETISKITELTAFHELKPLTAAIARNKSKDRLRRHLADKRGGNLVQSLDHIKESGADCDIGLLQKDFLDALTVTEVRDLLSELSLEVKKEYRLVLKDYYFDHLSHSEIADKRKIAASSVGKFLQRGISCMRVTLERRPKLQKELRSLLSDDHSVTVLLPLISATQMSPDNQNQNCLYSAPVRNPALGELGSGRKLSLSDEQIMGSMPDELPAARSLSQFQRTQLMESLREKFSSRTA
jgi:DNA-directed RNA polymerase specialized sigma24 family protein